MIAVRDMLAVIALKQLNQVHDLHAAVFDPLRDLGEQVCHELGLIDVFNVLTIDDDRVGRATG